MGMRGCPQGHWGQPPNPRAAWGFAQAPEGEGAPGGMQRPWGGGCCQLTQTLVPLPCHRLPEPQSLGGVLHTTRSHQTPKPPM